VNGPDPLASEGVPYAIALGMNITNLVVNTTDFDDTEQGGGSLTFDPEGFDALPTDASYSLPLDNTVNTLDIDAWENSSPTIGLSFSIILLLFNDLF